MQLRKTAIPGSLILICVMGSYLQAQVSLPSIFSDNMVLQRERAVPIWGHAQAGETIKVSFRDQSVSTVAKSDGRWRVDVPTGKAGGPFEMTIESQIKIVLKNILVGEVWVCSGQSNMQWSVRNSFNAEQEIASANSPEIRLFTVPCVASATPQVDCNSSWVVCSPQTIPDFSAVGYFFGKQLYEHLNVPIGLINTSWGGTNAETWTPRENIAGTPGLEQIRDRLLAMEQSEGKSDQEYLKQLAAWEKASRREDPGNTGFAKGWAKPDTKLDDWQTMDLPGRLDSLSGRCDFDGVVWFRKDVQVPETWAGKELMLELGPIDDYDITYFNGKQIGATGRETKRAWTVSRCYKVPGELVKAGRNVIAVRVVDNFMGGGFFGTAKAMKLWLNKLEPSIMLAGTWQYRIEAEIIPVETTLPKPEPQTSLGGVNSPCALYNAMIHPLLPFAIQGAIWYQGESNAGRAYEYRTLFPAMIQGWRTVWGQGNFPFLFVQLANYMQQKPVPCESNWAELRESQTMTLDASPNTAMAVIIDIGEANDIHPKNKQDVGKRLALAARAKAYGENIVYSGPIYDSMTPEGNKAVIRFRHVGGGLATRDGEDLKGFAIAGADGKFVWAKAKIQGDTVVVWNDDVAKPAAVRYAWADNPVCNLINKAGLPASPFRTDSELMK
ncbi:MAG: sialate O-acetylesterase [Phycisphaerae bacterium]|nr:sialate O-acetylesterase [Phycisphaerae bacterium]